MKKSKKNRVAILGPKGTNTHAAASLLLGLEKFEIIFCSSNEEAMYLIEKGDLNHGVVPITNSSTGLVNGVKDFWILKNGNFNTRGIYPILEASTPIKHCLLVRPGTDIKGIKNIFSHPEVFGQCRSSLKSMKGVKLMPALSTADAASKVASSNSSNDVAAIALPFTAQIYGLTVLKKNLQDSDKNKTTFHLIGRSPVRAVSGCKTAIIFSLKNKPGALAQVINTISNTGRNIFTLATIFTGDSENIAFYLEFEGHMEEEITSSILTLLRYAANKLTILGSFPELIIS